MHIKSICCRNLVENGPGRVSYEQLNANVDDRTSLTTDSLSVEKTAVSLLFKVKFYPFRKPSTNRLGTARFGGPNTQAGETEGDNGVLGAGIDFGLPDGSGFGYGSESAIKTFSFSSSRVSYVAK